MSIDPSLAEEYDTIDQLLFHPKEILEGTSEAFERVVRLFAAEGYAIHYRIAQLLRSATPNLPTLPVMLGYAIDQADRMLHGQDAGDNRELTSDNIELDHHNGLWGYRRGNEFVIPPVYNSGFDFSEGVAAVSIGNHHHYIDPMGRVAIKCPNYTAIKSFRNGEAIIVEDGVRKRIDHSGAILGIAPNNK